MFCFRFVLDFKLEMGEEKIVKLRNGLQVPIIGLGTSLRGKPKIDNQAFIDSVKYAIQLGYRHIDTVINKLSLFNLRNILNTIKIQKGKML